MTLADEEADSRLAFVVASVDVGVEQSIGNSFDRESQEPIRIGH